VIENLARDLQAEFPWHNGFSARNLWHMLDFYASTPASQNCNRWLQKSAGPKALPAWPTRFRQKSDFAYGTSTVEAEEQPKPSHFVL
jgi:hypothetical protein